MRENGMENRKPALFSEDVQKRMKRFFSGKAYPALVCLSALLGHAFSLEMAFGLPIVLSAAAALLVSDSVLPAITPIVTAVFTLSRTHTPGVPSHSDYLFTSGRPLLLTVALAVLVYAAVHNLKRAVGRGARLSRQLLVPMAVFASGLVLGGALSSDWRPESLVFGIVEAAFFVLLFVLFDLGLHGLTLDVAARYLAYVSALIALLLSSEVLTLYLGAASPITDGEVEKSLILFGWGIWTSMGAALTVLIPACFVGVIYSRRPYLYLAAATLALAATFATQSRGALIAGALAYIVSLIAAAVASERRWVYIALVAVIFSFGIGYAVASVDRLPELIGRLLADNGRFRLWRLGLAEFASSPLFGVGFFGFEYPAGEGYFTGADFLPPMMHSTPIQLLSATGLFGTVGYAVFRVSTVIHIFRERSVMRLLVFFSAGLMLLLSLVENYVFQLWPLLYHTAALAISRLPQEQRS